MYKKVGYNDGLPHKGTMSTNPVFEKISKIQRLYVPLCGPTSFCAYDAGMYYDYY